MKLLLLAPAVTLVCFAPARSGRDWILSPARRLSVAQGGYRVELSLISLHGPNADEMIGWGGDDPAIPSGLPQNLVGGLKVWRRGRPVMVPRSSFSDLGNVHLLNLFPTRNGLKIKIEGGDASTAYTAYLRIAADRVVERRVEDSEEADYDYEVTRYVSKNPSG